MPGSWLRADYQQMPYFVLLPADYDKTKSYPTILHLHQYQNHSGQPGQADPWYNTDGFRGAHPCIVVLPLCMIGAQTSTPTFNWGGVTSDLQQPIVYALAILDLVVTQYNGDRNRLFVTGNSMGGLGTWGILCNRGQRERFAAGIPISGSCYYNVGNETAKAYELKDFPIWSCHGSLDSQVSPAFDIAMSKAMQAIGGIMKFANDPSGQHDTWDSFYPRADVWNWLFAQRKGATIVASPDRASVIVGSPATITDAAGTLWTITPSGQIAINGSVDATTSNVTWLAWVGGVIWQCNAGQNWYSKASASAAWVGPTKASPMAPQVAASVGYTNATFGPVVAVTAASDPATSNPAMSAAAPWAPFAFFGTRWADIGNKRGGDGSVTLDGTGTTYGNGLCSAVPGKPFSGTAFGGGGYFEVVMRGTGPMSFWANDIETMNGVSMGNGPNPWPGQAAGFGNWMETDFAEFDTTGVYGFAMHNWYGAVGSGIGTSSVNSGSPAHPAGADYTRDNTYGFLWVPASATSQGYARWYFNGAQVGNTITWNQYNPASPPAPSEANGTAYSVLDKLHLALILGGAQGSTVTISRVSVWQASAANNLTTLNQPPPSASVFKVSGGKIIDPSGQPYIAVGMNNRPMTTSNADQILQLFPGLTFIRMPMGDFQDPAAWDGFIRKMEAARVVIMKEYHPWPMKPALSGADLAAEANTAGAWAKYYKDRPYVWIGSMNEPQSGQMTPEHVAVYNAVRAQDSNKVVMFVAGIGGGNPGATGAKVLDPNAYASMRNIVWDLHFYGWATKYSTDQAAIAAALMGSAAAGSGVAACKAIRSADGVVPVIIGEFGPSTSGASLDPNAAQVQQAVYDAASTGKTEGFAGWSWNADPYNALVANGALTQWGKSLAAAIRSAAPPPPPPPPPPPGPTLADLSAKLNTVAAMLSSVAADLAKLAH